MAASGPTIHKELRAVGRSTPAERAAFVAERREREADRNARRLEVAAEVAARGSLRIERDRGWLSAPPGTIPLTGELVSAGNELIDSIGHDRLIDVGASSKAFLAKGFLPPEAFQLSSPYFRFILQDEVVAAVTDYLGIVPVLDTVDVWYSVHDPGDLSKSQLWHIDPDDTNVVKVWVHLSDVVPASGPLTGIDARVTESLTERLGYHFGKESYRVADEEIEAAHRDGTLFSLEGPTGTVDFIDTCRCFHFGSRVSEGAPARRMAVYQFVTPYSFHFLDHREEAAFRHLASDASTELERLILGAD